jgi:hypothetical protein
MRYLTRGDLLLVFLLLMVAGLLFIRGRYGEIEGRAVLLISDEGTRSFSLDEKRSVGVEGPLGITWVEIRPGMARVMNSPCKGKVCMKGGWVKREGEVIVCIPNHVEVRILGGTDLDAVSR